MDAHNIKVTRDEKAWEVEVKAEIAPEALARYREEALKEMQRDARLDGFRAGKAPIDRILAVYGEETVMRHAAQHAIQHELPEILASEKLLVIESPRVQTDPPVAGKPLAFTARAALAPRIELPDYASIAKKHNASKEEVSVSDEEHAQAMTHLKRERTRIEKVESGTEPQKAAEESQAIDEKELAALDDAFTKSLGYESAEKFSDALRENIKNEKELKEAEKRRQLILDDLVATSKISYPQQLREYELNEMEARLQDDLSRFGQTFESYLEQVKKTREELRAEWEEPADKRAKVRLALAEIARKENIEPDQEAIKSQLEHARKHYPQADPEALRAHISHAMRNEMVLKFLEEQ